MKRAILVLLFAMLALAAVPASADQTYSYWAWHSNTDDDIYCFSYFPNIQYYYTYQQVGGKTVYCDSTESSWGATWCELDVRLEDATPCYYGNLQTPSGPDPSRFFFGAPSGRRRGLPAPAATLTSTLATVKRSCAKS